MRFPESWTVFPLGRSSLLAVPGQVQEFLTLASQKSDWRTGFSLYKSMHPSDLEEPEGESRKQKQKKDKERLRHSSRLNNSATQK